MEWYQPVLIGQLEAPMMALTRILESSCDIVFLRDVTHLIVNTHKAGLCRLPKGRGEVSGGYSNQHV